MFSCTNSMPCNLPVRCGFGTVSNWCVNCLSMALFFLACLWSAACKQNNGTSRNCASRFALSTMLRAMFSQYMPMTWPSLNKSVLSSFLQFSILRDRSWAKWSSDKGAVGVHLRMAAVISGKWASRNPLDFFKWITVYINAHQCRLGSMVFCPALCAAFCGSALRDCQLRRSRWQAWSAKNHLQSAKLVCVPWALLGGNSWLDQGLHLGGRACFGKASFECHVFHSYLAFLSGILLWHSSLAFYLALYLTFFLAFYLLTLFVPYIHAYLKESTSHRVSDILSGKAFGIPIWHSFCILSGIPSAILICHTFWHRSWGLAFHLPFLSGILIWHSSLAFYLALYLTFFLAFYLLTLFVPYIHVFERVDITQSFWHSIWQSFWHSIWHSFWHSIWHSICHFYLSYLLAKELRSPAANTGRGWSWLRSGSEHWAWMVVVEVRQRTLGVDGRGWGPAANTGRGSSWLRSGSEHSGVIIVVEVRRGGGGGEGEGAAAGVDIKSNNPHLAGGQKTQKRWAGFRAVSKYKAWGNKVSSRSTSAYANIVAVNQVPRGAQTTGSDRYQNASKCDVS